MTWHKRVAITGHSAPVYACMAREKWIYSSAGDRFVTRWSAETGEQDAFAIRLDAAAYCLGWAEAPGYLVIGCTNGTVIAIDATSKQLVWEHNFLGKALFSCVDCPAEQFLVLGDHEGQLLVVDYSGTLIATFHLNCGKIRQLKRYGQQLFAACQDGTVRIFDLPTFNEVRTITAHKGGATALQYFPQDFTLLSGGKDAHLRLWDTLTGQELLAIPAHYQTIYGIETVATTGAVVTVSMDKTIKLWNPDTWKVEQRIEFKQGGHHRSVNGCIPVGSAEFATFGDDKLIAVWSQE